MSENTDNGENISNDIKNNAGKINDLVELEKERKDALEKVNLISEKVNVIEKIMSDIFDATMDELDHLEINVREEESGIVETYFRKMTTVKNITIANNIPECLVYMDKLRLEQVFDNVISNSVKYSGTEINVSFDEIEGIANEKGRKDSFIKITIRDKGPGVPEDELPLITEKYYRGSDVKEKDGFGIGLYLVKVYMEKQGGGFEYYNDDGFVVELYLKKV
jgi:signal transduction histidine kinase